VEISEMDPAAATFPRITLRADKRGECRYVAMGTVLVCLPDSSRERISAKCIDVSKSGMRLRMDQRFAPGTTLHVFLGKVCLVGAVQYCRRMGRGFEHGVLIERPSAEAHEITEGQHGRV